MESESKDDEAMVVATDRGDGDDEPVAPDDKSDAEVVPEPTMKKSAAAKPAASSVMKRPG